MRKFLTQRIFHRIYFQSFLQNVKLIAFIYGIFSGFERGLLYVDAGGQGDEEKEEEEVENLGGDNFEEEKEK